MGPCPTCGTELSYRSKDNKWYCKKCKLYHDTTQQQGVRHRPKKRRILVAITTVVVIMVVVAAIFLVLFPEDDESKTVTMTFKEFVDDQDPIGLGYKSIDSGDILIIEDTVLYLESEYNEDEGDFITYFWFESSHSGENEVDWYDDTEDEWIEYDVIIKGNLTDQYMIGDEVVITLHCISIEIVGTPVESFTEIEQDPDSDALPRSSIKKA